MEIQHTLWTKDRTYWYGSVLITIFWFLASAVTDGGPPAGVNFFKEEYILNNAIGTLSVPWIAMIDGITMGGVGCL